MPRDRYDDRDEQDDDDRDYDRPRRRRPDDSVGDDDRPRRRQRDHDDSPVKSGGGKVVFIVLGIVGGVLVVVGVGLVLLLMPFIQKTRTAAARMKTQNDLKEAALAEYDFEGRTGSYSRPYLDTDDRGMTVQIPTDPSARLSWRVAMLPYLMEADATAAYRRFKLTEAWDGPTNGPLRNTTIKAYLHPMDAKDGEPTTRIRCFYDNGAMFDSNPQVRINPINITDGTSNTIMFVETADRVPWPQFNELKFDPAGSLPALGHPGYGGGFNVVMADGSVRFIRDTVSPQTLKAVITRAGGEVAFLD